MPKQHSHHDYNKTLDDLRRMLEAEDGSLLVWFYPEVVKRLAGAAYLAEHVPAGIEHVSKRDLLAKGLAGAESVEKFIRWIVVCVKNKALDKLKKENRRRYSELTDDTTPSVIPGSYISDPLSAFTPELQAEILPRLTPKERELFGLYLRKMRPRDMAVALGWTPATTWSRRAELKKKIMDILRENVEGEDRE